MAYTMTGNVREKSICEGGRGRWCNPHAFGAHGPLHEPLAVDFQSGLSGRSKLDRCSPGDHCTEMSGNKFGTNLSLWRSLRRTPGGRRAIAPATATFQHVHDAADDAAIVRPLDAPYVRRQVRFDPIPLLIAQPKQVPAHDPDPLPKTNQDRIVRPEKLMSSDPS